MKRSRQPRQPRQPRRLTRHRPRSPRTTPLPARQLDETPIDCLKPGHGKTKTGYLWVSNIPGGSVIDHWRKSRDQGGITALFDREDADEKSAILYTLVENCRSFRINPRDYFEDLLTRLPAMLASQAVTLPPANGVASSRAAPPLVTEGRSLFVGIADPTTAVDLQDGVMSRSHHQRCNDSDTALRPESSDGSVDYGSF